MRKIVYIILIFIPVSIFGQNQNSSTIDYQKIETEHFELIFPDEISKKALETASMLENLYDDNTSRLQAYPEKISLVIYNQSTISNAYARIAPSKMGWYITPTQNSSLGITDWFGTLSLHEYRHVIQDYSVKHNFTKLGTWLFGDYGWAALQYSIPGWYFEGDAIFTETIFSESGRGRSSNFSLPMRTILLSGQDFNYSQAYLRSYKNFYPNHYYLGYYMVTHVNRNFGEQTWSNVMYRTSLYSFWPFAFSRSLKKFTGYNVRKTYKNTIKELDSIWNEQIADLEITDAKIINKEKKQWLTYFESEFYNDSTIIALKFSYDKNNTLTKIDLKGNEEKIKVTDAGMISASQNKIVWARENPDLRWGEQDYSDIVVYNLETKEEKEITKNGKYFSPTLNPAGTQIAVVEYTTDLKCSLVILNSENGEIIKSFPSKNNDFIRIPAWSDDGKKLVYCNSSIDGQGISIIDIETGDISEVIGYSWENFSRPVFYNNYILYNSEYSGIGNIYAIDIDSKQKYQVTSRKFGAYNSKVSPDKSKIIFQDYNENGYDVALIDINIENWKKIEVVEVNKVEYFDSEKFDPKCENLITSEILNANNYEITDYKEFKNLINLHSWMVNLRQDYSGSIEGYSANKLNTLMLTAGINYSVPANAASIYTTASYQKYFPIFDFSLQYGNEFQIYDKFYLPYKNIDSLDVWKETNIGLGTRIPLNFSKGLYSRNLTGSINSFYKIIEGKDISYLSENQLLTNYQDGQFLYMNYAASFSNYKQTAVKDVRTRFGQSVSVSFRHSIFDNEWTAKQFSAIGNFYFPGIFRHQSLILYVGYEKQIDYQPNSEINLYYFGSKISSIRGRNLSYFYDEIYKTTVDYEFPILYPDLAIGKIMYIKRVKMLGFYDFFSGKFNDEVYNKQSTGFQLLFDVSFLHINQEFEIGTQGAYLLPDNKMVWSIMFNGIEF